MFRCWSMIYDYTELLMIYLRVYPRYIALVTALTMWLLGGILPVNESHELYRPSKVVPSFPMQNCTNPVFPKSVSWGLLGDLIYHKLNVKSFCD